MPTMSHEEIEAGLRDLGGWSRSGESIERTFEFDRFADGIEFVRKVAVEADRMDHHPDIDIRYTSVKMSLSSHDSGGVTQRDFRLAKKIDSLA